jgi:hypothetical protein
MKHKPNKPLLVGLVAVETVSAVLAWRDLGRRSEDQVAARRTSGACSYRSTLATRSPTGPSAGADAVTRAAPHRPLRTDGGYRN